MGVIQALGQQWHKAEFAKHLSQSLLSHECGGLFQGATSMMTVCNLMSAMAYRADDPRYQLLDDELLIYICFNCFRLLFVKEVEQGNLSQAEQLILTLCQHLATRIPATALSQTALGLQAQILSLSGQLESMYQQKRSKNKNMLPG